MPPVPGLPAPRPTGFRHRWLSLVIRRIERRRFRGVRGIEPQAGFQVAVLGFQLLDAVEQLHQEPDHLRRSPVHDINTQRQPRVHAPTCSKSPNASSRAVNAYRTLSCVMRASRESRIRFPLLSVVSRLTPISVSTNSTEARIRFKVEAGSTQKSAKAALSSFFKESEHLAGTRNKPGAGKEARRIHAVEGRPVPIRILPPFGLTRNRHCLLAFRPIAVHNAAKSAAVHGRFPIPLALFDSCVCGLELGERLPVENQRPNVTARARPRRVFRFGQVSFP